MKKIAIIVGGIFALILGAIIIIPLVVDVNKYNPQIVKAANEKMNGSLELGRLSMNLWGKIHIGVDGLVVRDSQKRAVVAVKDASFDMPYFSIFSGAPLITLRMVKPEIVVIKNKEGKLNVMNLMKPSAPEAAAAGGGAPADSQKVELPSMAMNAHIGVSIEDAKLVYKDEAMALSNTIDQFNLRVKDFSLTRKTEMEVWADLKTAMADLKVEGPLKLIVELTPEVSGGEFKSAAVNANFTADDLTIQKGDLFMKKKGIPANFKFDGVLSQENLKLNSAAAKFHNAEIVVSGSYHQIQGANIKFEAKPIDLKPWSELVPMLKEYELEGKVGLKGEAKGTADALQYTANLVAQNFAMKGPMLKAKPVINAEILVATDRIEKFNVDLKGPGNEIVLSGKMLSFSKPQLTFAITSPKGMDLDQWIDFPKPEKGSAKKEEKSSGSSAGSGGGAAGKAADYDAMLDPLRKNDIAKAMVVDGSVSIAFMKAMGVRIDDISAKIQMKNLVAALSALKMKMYDGTIAGGFTVDMKPVDPQYTTNLNVAGFDMQKAVEAQFQSFKDTIIGKLTVNMTGAGSSFNAEEIKRKLQMKGDFKILNATFKTIDIAKIANGAIGGVIDKLGGKVPALAGKRVNIPANKESRYDVSSSFTLSGGTLDAPNFLAKALTGGSLDVKGATKMGLVDESLDARWELVDSKGTIPPINVTNPIGGGQINNVLAKGEKDVVILPITVTGKWSDPSPSYTATAEYLAGVVAGRMSKSVGEAAKAKATSAVQEAVKKVLPPGNPLKGLFGQ